ncbi:MAG: RIP metalloprotease RseP [Verrucomicrobium sp.]|nr:RIP metalloprotease RseP [Verrucomicrobium sp.]
MDFILNILHYVVIIFLVIMVFNLMILVHEWGHFLAARWRGLKVEKFQIWFGNPIWKRTYNGVQYGLGWIPAGGFVALPQMAPMDAIEGGGDDREQLPPITPLDKIIVAFAGPLFSFMLACVFAVLVWHFGKPEYEALKTTTIGYVAKESAAAKFGLKAGDEIISVDGNPVKNFGGLVDSVRWNIIRSENNPIPFVVKREGSAEPVKIEVEAEIPKQKPGSWWSGLFRRPELRQVGIVGKQTPMIKDVKPHSPADEAGLKSMDQIVSVNGMTLLQLPQLSEYIGANPDKPLELMVVRDVSPTETKTFAVTVTPRKPDVVRPSEKEKDIGKVIGVIWDQEGKREIAHPEPQVQIKEALKTMQQTIAAISSPKSEVSTSHLSGPIGIGRVYYNLMDDPYGWLRVMWFSVVLNVNLAVMNLLPFPVLDGGHITMALYEWIRRRPINIRILEVVQTACVFILLGFMVFVSMKDAGDIGGGGGSAPAPIEIEFLPPNQRQGTPAQP